MDRQKNDKEPLLTRLVRFIFFFNDSSFVIFNLFLQLWVGLGEFIRYYPLSVDFWHSLLLMFCYLSIFVLNLIRKLFPLSIRVVLYHSSIFFVDYRRFLSTFTIIHETNWWLMKKKTFSYWSTNLSFIIRRLKHTFSTSFDKC